jgi:hypothetical protein
MFGHRKLLEDGVKGEAVVTGAHGRTGMAPSPTGIDRKTKLDLRARFPDGSTTSWSETVRDREVGHTFVGRIVPVRYDGNDHDKIAIDVPLMKARHSTQRTAIDETQQALIAQSEQVIASGEGPPARTDSPARSVTATEADDALKDLAYMLDEGAISEREFAEESERIRRATGQR